MPAVGTRWRETATGLLAVVVGECVGHVLLRTDHGTEASVEVRFFVSFWRQCG